MPKKTVEAPSPEIIEATAKTTAIRKLVWLADAFHRCGARGPFGTEMPILVAAKQDDGQYRRVQLQLGELLETDHMKVGARDGLIFVFRPKNAIERKNTRGETHKIEAVEIKWVDVENIFLTLADEIEQRIMEKSGELIHVQDLDAEIRSVIQRNKNMHPIIVQGFAKAQELAKSNTSGDALESLAEFGMF